MTYFLNDTFAYNVIRGRRIAKDSIIPQKACRRNLGEVLRDRCSYNLCGLQWLESSRFQLDEDSLHVV